MTDRCVITGLNRLTVRVARRLVRRGCDVVVVAPADEHAPLLPADVELIDETGPWPDLLRRAKVEQSDCVLALSDDDLDNLRAATAAGDVAPDVPVMLRAFDAQLAERFEAAPNVRRAYSSSALAAPAYVAAALGQHVVETLRLGDEEIPMCRLTVQPGSPLAGLTPGQVKTTFRCAAVARTGPDGRWQPAYGDAGTLREGDELVVGGLLLDVLRLALRNSTVLTRRQARLPRHRPARGERPPTLVPAATVALIAVLALSIGVFAASLDLGPTDAIYAAFTNAFGDAELDRESGWLKIFGVVVMVAGAVLVGVLLTHVAAVATANRIEEQAGRRARRMRDHVVVAGLGGVGFRVERLLDRLDVPSVVLEREINGRFRSAAAAHSPVITGDIRLPEDLERAGVGAARCIVACTDDDLANVAACAQARHLNPGIRTVARVFDEDIARRLHDFGVDAAMSTSLVAASAFAGAASDERAPRTLRLGDVELVALRHVVTRPVSADELTAWRADGLRVLAAQPPDGQPQPPTAAAQGLAGGATLIAAGPPDVVERLLTV